MNATPLDGILNKKKGISKQHLIIAGAFFIVAIVLGATAFVLNQQVATTQTTVSRAALPSCISDTIPLDADPKCYKCKDGKSSDEEGTADAPKDGHGGCIEGAERVGNGSGRDYACSWCPQDAPTRLTGRNDNWISCPAPREGLCKSKGSMCAECRTDSEYKQICYCQDNTPTPPQKTPSIACPVPQVVTNVSISCPSCSQ